ncbi:MAG: DUF998 domain-containing protein [Nakamurella sp.]
MTTIDLRRTPTVVATPHVVSPVTGLTALAQPARVAAVAAIAAVPPITLLHLSATGGVEPVGWTISDYVVTLPYGVPLYAMTVGALAIGGGVLVRGLAQLAGTRSLRILLAIWAAALLATAVFPTNHRGTPEDISSNVHLIAGAVVFAVLPVAGLLLARWLRSTTGRTAMTIAVTVVSVISGLLSLALILNRLPGVVGLPQLMLPPGILQRSAGALEIVLLAVIGLAVLVSVHRVRVPAGR